MRYFSFSFIIILPIILIQYPRTESRKTDQKFTATGSKESMVFEEIEHNINNITETDKCLEFEILLAEYKIKMSLNKENETAKLILDKRIVITDFNFVYDTDLESAIGEIKVLKSKINDDIILFLPITTEEFATFQIIKYESQTKTFRNGIFTINTHKYNNVLSFYLTNSIKLNLVKNKFEILIGDFKNNGEFRKMKSSKKAASC
jgi:hypothetical protein